MDNSTKQKLWKTADQLRSNMDAAEYKHVVLGLIFLKYISDSFSALRNKMQEDDYYKNNPQYIDEDMRDYCTEHNAFWVPNEARWEFLRDNAPQPNIGKLIDDAMLSIEKENPKLKNILNKNYARLSLPQGRLADLINTISTIGFENGQTAPDALGEVYEYFLGMFADAEGKRGGQFYTAASVVKTMVAIMAPTENHKVYDPCCGSGGMFVQAARYMHRHNATNQDMMSFRCYGVEKEPDTVKLAKMNLLLNNVRGEITEANSFYSDPYNAFGRFDYVMANPPFNVDEVVFDKVCDDARFNTYGVPRNKTKSAKKASDKKETVPNANYLWIGYFATALNENGKAALVMANSASDAGGSELEIRKKMIQDGIISQMVTLPSNMFSTVTLPATLWFFNKQCTQKDEILFIDARNIFTQVDRAHRKFSDEQIKNLGVITRLYEGDSDAFWTLVNEYKSSGKQEEADWLLERWPDGKYRDVIGLCKVAKITGEDGIEDNDWSLNAGRYVGVVIEDDGMTSKEFRAEMLSLNGEFSKLSAEAADLQKEIEKNMMDLFGEE